MKRSTKKLTKKEIEEYAGRSKAEWIKWAEREIAEYKNFIKFLKTNKDLI